MKDRPGKHGNLVSAGHAGPSPGSYATAGRPEPAGWLSFFLDGESGLSEHGDGAALSALEIAGGKALARGELISRARMAFGG
jgi:hypothetical protein